MRKLARFLKTRRRDVTQIRPLAFGSGSSHRQVARGGAASPEYRSL
jgi:hypothetical protein